ncbi:MAG: phosphodiester glycosidase family protein [Lentisphaeria bacterium]|nr:phosphodiester glycosidase family protein [Lentisphaeria bacterium]
MKRITGIALFFAALVLSAVEQLDWSKAEEVQTGVVHLRIEETRPRLMKISILRIDLQTPGLDFTATGRDKNWGKEMPDCKGAFIRTKRQRTRDFMKEQRGKGLNMIVAVNAAPWSPWKAPFNHKYANPSGVNILNGEVVSENRGRRPCFVIYEDGTPAIVPHIPEKDYARIKVAVSGFSIVAKDGKSTFNDKHLAPRTAYGISADKRYIYILGVDGRQPDWSMGMTCKEAGLWLLAAGASDAINMDGGGSTTLIYWDKKKKTMVSLCRHSKSRYERVVGSNFGIYLKKK